MLRRLTFFLAGSALSIGGCSSDHSTMSGATGLPGKHDGATSDVTGVAITLDDGADSLTFTPGRSVEVPVLVTPPATYTVRFSLTGNAQDAYLDQSELQTDANGSTKVLLSAPSTPTNFSLRASVPGATAELEAYANSAETTLEVVPAYGGHRAVKTWVASVTADGIPCDPFASVPPPDGKIPGLPGTGDSVNVPGVPIGKPLRVTVRAGHFAGGCANVSPLTVGDQHRVSVTVTDRPLQMGGVSIPVVLGVDKGDPWTSAWSSLAAKMGASAIAGAGSDAEALLEEMLDATPYLSQDAFIYESGVLDWQNQVDRILTKGPGKTAIRDAITRWLMAGLTPFATNAVSGTITSLPGLLGTASLGVTQVAGDAPSSSGFPALLGLSWTSAPGDEVFFDTSAWWQPSRLAATLALGAAKKEIPAASSVADALSTVISCKDIGNALVGDAQTSLTVACNASCMVTRCENALDTMWKRAGAAATKPVAVHITASAATVVDDTAHPSGFSGTWLGDVSLGGASIQVTGSASSGVPSKSPR